MVLLPFVFVAVVVLVGAYFIIRIEWFHRMRCGWIDAPASSVRSNLWYRVTYEDMIFKHWYAWRESWFVNKYGTLRRQAGFGRGRVSNGRTMELSREAQQIIHHHLHRFDSRKIDGLVDEGEET